MARRRKYVYAALPARHSMARLSRFYTQPSRELSYLTPLPQPFCEPVRLFCGREPDELPKDPADPIARHTAPARAFLALINTPFATRCSKKAKSWRNGHKMGPSGATRQQGLTGGVGGRGLVHNTRVQPLVCAVSPANTLATPIPLRLTADAIMQDLHQTGCSRPAWSWGAAGLLPTPSL